MYGNNCPCKKVAQNFLHGEGEEGGLAMNYFLWTDEDFLKSGAKIFRRRGRLYIRRELP